MWSYESRLYGYHLQQAIGEEMRKRGIDKEIAAMITQVLVDKEDLAFSNPSKPIGSFFQRRS